jgi:ubiquinone/menaquinone biosynthesis C-methylase UbiE
MSANLANATLSAYERWAPIYPPVAHNPLMRAEQQAMLEHWPEVAGKRALDLACGSGRYTGQLAQSGARKVVATDFCVPMLQRVAASHRVCANMMSLPFVNNAFDVVICGLALGHATELYPWMAQIARVLAPGGTLLYSDFHPDAALAGLTRSFKDGNDETCTVPHRYFDVESQRGAAQQAGLQVECLHEVRVGVELREPFEHSQEFYQRWHGLPIVLVVRARRLSPEMT